LSFHLAGIIPVTTKAMDFGMAWHDCLMPIAPNFYAIERAVYECAMAGCETIWIVANDDVSPLVRHRIGDYVQDPVYLGRKAIFPSAHRRRISVYYVPLSVAHDNKDWCISWSIIHGASVARDISLEISKWVAPKKYYVAFPYSVYDVKYLRNYRKDISSDDNFSLTSSGESFKDNKMLGFSFGDSELSKAKELFESVENSMTAEDLKDEKDFFFRKFSLAKVFKHVILHKTAELSWSFPIDSWETYCQYLSSEEKNQIRHPGKLILSYREANPIGTNKKERK
jgi:hypothetical protein